MTTEKAITSDRRNFPGCITQRGDAYRVRLYVGRGRYLCRTYDTEREARHFAKTKAAEAAQTAKARRKRGFSLGAHFLDLVAAFEARKLPDVNAASTKRAYEQSLETLRVYWRAQGNPKLEDIDAVAIDEFVSWRRRHRRDGEAVVDAGVSARTAAKDRALLHLLFKWGRKWKLVEHNPVGDTEAPKGDKRAMVILSDAEYERLLAACHDPMLLLFVLTCGESGVRSESEALRLRWEDVDLKDRFLYVVTGRDGHRTKTGESRPVKMSPRLVEAMRAHFEQFRLATYDGERSEWVFHHVNGRAHQKPGARIGSLRRAFQQAAKRAKLPPGFTQHQLRHRAGTLLVARYGIAKAQKQLGHASARTTEIYTHFTKEHLRDLFEDQAQPQAKAEGAL